MANLENRPDFEQISRPKPIKRMTPHEIIDELHQGDGEADEAKPMPFPTEGKIPGARRLNKVGSDKGEQFRLQDELEKLQKEMRSEINIANKISRQLKDGKDELRAQQVREKYEPKITVLAGELREMFGEKKGVEDFLPQLREQAKENEEKRTQKIRKDREEAAKDKAARFQKITITPELRAVQKKAAQKDIENAYAKLVDAEDALAEAEKNRPGAFSRFFSRFKIVKPQVEVVAYKQAFQDKNTPPEELKKLEAAAIEAMSSKPSAAEITYQQALRAVEDAKKLVEETEKSILDSGILYTEPKKRKRFGRNEEPLVAPKKLEKATLHKPAIQAGEYEIKFKPEPTRAQRKVEVNLPKKAPEPEISPEAVLDARQQLENYIKNISFTYPEHKLVVLQNAAFQENLADNNFQGDSLTLKKTIKHTLEQLAKELKLKPHEEIASLAELMPQKDKRFKKMTTADKNFRHYLALKDLEQNTARH